MSNKPDGGSAFPGPYLPDESLHYTGMTLRDYFAAKALQSLALHNAARDSAWVQGLQAANLAYAYADAMLAARQ